MGGLGDNLDELDLGVDKGNSGEGLVNFVVLS